MKPCPFCKQQPAIHRHTKSQPVWFQVECVSNECAMREVRTHRCGNEAEAVRIWDERAD